MATPLATAKLLLLALNPGYHEADDKAHLDPNLRKLIIDNLSNIPTKYPHYYLHEGPGFDNYPGFKWWKRILKKLIDIFDTKELSQKIACVQFHGYHSKMYRLLDSKFLPSQEKTFEMIRKSMAKETMIVVMRSYKIWLTAIPELNNYPHLILLKNPRNPTISSGNMQPGDFEKILITLNS